MSYGMTRLVHVRWFPFAIEAVASGEKTSTTQIAFALILLSIVRRYTGSSTNHTSLPPNAISRPLTFSTTRVYISLAAYLTMYILAQHLLRPQLNLNTPVIFHDNLHPLIAARTALIKSTIFLGIRVAMTDTNQMSRSIMRSIPSRNIRIRDLPKL
jgi:hypothetical protein